jgi:aspartate carbamoyltransferase catalytic subunit
MLLPRLGARVILCGPVALLPEYALGLGEGVEIERDFDKALRQAQVVMMLRIQRERLAGLELDLAQYVDRYQLHIERLEANAPKALVMHPGPMIRGLEIAGEVADGPNSAIEDQVRHGLVVRSALLVRALGEGRFESVMV